MTDNKKDEKTLSRMLSDAIDLQLEQDPPEKPTLEEFKAMAYERLAAAEMKKKRKRRLCKLGVAASFIVAVLIGAFALNMITDDVGADKNPKEEIITEDGVIIEDGGYGSSVGEDNVWTISDWKHIEAAKKTYPEVAVIKYIPKGYTFEELEVTVLETNAIVSKYIFKDNNCQSIEIECVVIKKGEISTSISGVVRTIDSERGKIYFQNTSKKKATIQLDNGISVVIWGEINDNEFVKIVNGISF